MRSMSIGIEPIAVTSLNPTPQTVSDGSFAQSLQDTVDVGSPNLRAPKPVQSGTEQSVQDSVPQESLQPAQSVQETQPQEAPQAVVETPNEAQEVSQAAQNAQPQQEVTDSAPLLRPSGSGFTYAIDLSLAEENTESDLMKELADLLGETEEMLTAPQRMQETLKDLIDKAFKELADPEADKEEFTEKVLEFLLKFIDKAFGGKREETSVFKDNDEDDTDVQDVLLQAVVQMLDNIRSEDAETGVPEDTEDAEAVDGIPSTNMAKEYVSTTANELLEPFEELEKQATEPNPEIFTDEAADRQSYTAVSQPETPEEAVNPQVSTEEQTVQVIPEEAKVSEPVQPVDTVEAVQPIERVEPVEAAQPIELAETAETVKAVEAAQPIEAVKSVEAAQPTEAVKPVEAAQSIEAVKPVEAAQPIEAVKPVEAVKSVETAQTVEAVKPVETAQPEEAADNALYQAAAQAAESIYTAIVQPQKPAAEQVQPVRAARAENAERSREVRTVSVIQPADELEELTRLVKGGDTVKPEQSQPQPEFGGKQEAELVKPAVKLEAAAEAVPFEAVIARSVPQITLTHPFAGGEGGAEQIVAQIASEIFNQLPEGGGTTTFVMTLNPESLGKVTVKVVEEAGKISVSVTAHSRRTAEMLSERFDSLNTAMKENGTQLEKYQVVYAPEKDERSGQQNFDGSSKNPYVKQDDEESEGDGEFAELLQQVV